MSRVADPDAVDGIPAAALAVGEVVILERTIFADRPRSYATVVDEGEAPVVAGPGVTAPTDARVLVVRERTDYDAVLGQDSTGAYHLRDRSWVDVVAEPGGAVVCRQHLADDELERWFQFVAERRGWQAVPGRFVDLVGGERDA